MSDALRALAERGVPRFVPRGRRLITEGESGSTLYLILSGRLRAFSVGTDGGRGVTYGEYGAGEYVGEMSLDDGPRSADIEAVQAGWVVLITRETLLGHIAEHPAFALELLTKVIRRARATSLSLRALALNDVYGRIAGLLNDRARPGPDGSRTLGPITQREIARLASCTPSMVSKVMAGLLAGGYVRQDGGCIVLLRRLPARF